jgi:hypothetical protein
MRKKKGPSLSREEKGKRKGRRRNGHLSHTDIPSKPLVSLG